MVRILNGYTYQIGCEHRNVAVVTQLIGENAVYLTLMFDDQNVEFKMHNGQLTKLSQEPLEIVVHVADEDDS